MYKKMLLLMMVVVLVICAGCRKNSVDSTEDSMLGVVEVNETRPEKIDESAQTTPSITDSEKETELKGNEVTQPTEQVTQPKETEPHDEKETEPVATEPAATEPAATEPVATEPVATEPPVTLPPVTEPSVNVGMTSYEWYNSLSGEAQLNFFNTFESMEAFVNWYNAAKAEHDSLRPDINVGDGNIDLGEIGS